MLFLFEMMGHLCCSCRAAIDYMFKSTLRKGRSSKLIDPMETRKTLIRFHEAANYAKFSGHEEFPQRPGTSIQ